MSSTFDFFPWFRNFSISPQTDWQRFINPQFNVTVNQGDVAVENHVLARVGSYGKQLGRIQEVLDILIEALPEAELSPSGQRTIASYRKMRANVVAAVDEAKRERGDRDDAVDLDRWLGELASMRDDDPVRFRRESNRLRQFLEAHPAARGKPSDESSDELGEELPARRRARSGREPGSTTRSDR